MTDTLFTFETLGTLLGAATLTFLIVQYTKNYIDKVFHIPTNLYATAVGGVVLLLSQLAVGANYADWRIYVLALFNGFLVAATTAQMNDSAITPPAPKKFDDSEGL